jgi:hypothetical protein
VILTGTLSGSQLVFDFVLDGGDTVSAENWNAELQYDGTSAYLGTSTKVFTAKGDGKTYKVSGRAVLRAAPPVPRDVYCDWRETHPETK